MVIITAILKAKEGKGDLLEQELKKMVQKVHTEPGAIMYVAHRDINNPLRFLIYERYKNKEATEEHRSTPHFKEFSKVLESLADGRMEVNFYDEIQ